MFLPRLRDQETHAIQSHSIGTTPSKNNKREKKRKKTENKKKTKKTERKKTIRCIGSESLDLQEPLLLVELRQPQRGAHVLRHLRRSDVFSRAVRARGANARRLRVEGAKRWLWWLKPMVPLVNIKIGGKWMFIHPKMEPWVMPHGHVGTPGFEPVERCFWMDPPKWGGGVLKKWASDCKQKTPKSLPSPRWYGSQKPLSTFKQIVCLGTLQGDMMFGCVFSKGHSV